MDATDNTDSQAYMQTQSLLQQLPYLSDEQLKREYLNYLKWTEPLAQMLQRIDEEAIALRMVNLALEVDLRLAARLAGAVKPECCRGVRKNWLRSCCSGVNPSFER